MLSSLVFLELILEYFSNGKIKIWKSNDRKYGLLHIAIWMGQIPFTGLDSNQCGEGVELRSEP